MSDSLPDIRKSARVWILPTVLLCCSFGFIAWLATPEDDPIIEPKPEMFYFTVSDEVRAKLPATVRLFLEQLEARKVSGRSRSFVKPSVNSLMSKTIAAVVATFSAWMITPAMISNRIRSFSCRFKSEPARSSIVAS
jgi:hypothetical protein